MIPWLWGGKKSCGGKLKPGLIASISNSHLQNRLSDVYTRSPHRRHSFWRWSSVWESPVAPSHKRVFSRCRWPREVSAGTTLTSPGRCQRLYPPHSHLCGCGQGLESSLGASQERDENSHLRSVGRTPWVCWATWVCLDGGHTVTVSLSSCKKRALDSPLTLTEPPGMLASQLPTSAIPGAREKGSLLVWIPLRSLSGWGQTGGETGQPRPAWGRLARPPCPPNPPPLPCRSLLLRCSPRLPSPLSPASPASPALSHTHPLFIFLPPSGPC